MIGCEIRDHLTYCSISPGNTRKPTQMSCYVSRWIEKGTKMCHPQVYMKDIKSVQSILNRVLTDIEETDKLS
jgi:hypothetical protein